MNITTVATSIGQPKLRATLAVSALAVMGLGVSVLLRRKQLGFPAFPCPASLSFLLENPYFNGVAGAQAVLDRAGVEPGMRVLDVGCGPGRVTLPAAKRVGPTGEVVALDIQTDMLHRVEKKLSAEHITNVHLLYGGIGAGLTEAGTFDRALLVAVLGEIPNKVSALCEIWRALRPGGVLSITEVFLDPHLQTPATIRRFAHQTGFEVKAMVGRFPAFTINLVKPLDSAESQGECD